jgi:23S rRNA (uracil1939-C5)-methyltransferase
MSELFTVEVESLDLEGRGIARRDGKVAFIAGALPGEWVEYQRLRSKSNYDSGRVVRVLRESAARVVPRCPHFGLDAGACGGCSMQHVEPRTQVAIKQRVLEDALWHVGRLRPDLILRPIAGPTWHYRFRARLAVRYVPKKGGVLVGFHERASSYVADMRECHVLPAKISALLMPLRALIGALSVRDRLPQIELAVTDRATVLVLRVLRPLTADDRERLQAFAAQHQVAIWLQPGGPDSAAPLTAHGEPLVLALPEFGLTLPFAPTDFTQVNHRINEVLVRRAVRLLGLEPQHHVVDFFCGLGNFTLPLATRAACVIGIEGHGGLMTRATAAARQHGLAQRCRFEQRDLFGWERADWQSLWDELGGVDRVLLDPPREGAQAVAKALASSTLRPGRIVYVSCNPATLARDCAILVHEGGWRLCAAGAVNMFPHTSHVESIAVLEPA